MSSTIRRKKQKSNQKTYEKRNNPINYRLYSYTW